MKIPHHIFQNPKSPKNPKSLKAAISLPYAWLVRGLRFGGIVVIRLYKRLLSPLSVGACRYYPSCSEYALWLFYFDHPLLAAYKTIKRVLSCNQLFEGGVSYPSARLTIRPTHIASRADLGSKIIKYWLVPSQNQRFLGIMRGFRQTYTMRVYIIKSLS